MGDRKNRVVARAVVFEQPEVLTLREFELPPPGPGEVLINVECSGISTGTEKLLWTGQMPAFPGLGYPLVPGYETVGIVAACGAGAQLQVGERVFASGARCYGDVRGLFGGASSHLLTTEAKTIGVEHSIDDEAILLALAATAHHALFDGDRQALPDLIIGHGVVGRLLARLTIALGGFPPTVWETNAQRRHGTTDYTVTPQEIDDRRDYRCIIDASGDPAILDVAVASLAKQGEVVLAGFYAQPLAFNFVPAFMREAAIRIAAEWQPIDLTSVNNLLKNGALNFDDLITHRMPAAQADSAYRTAFADPACLKMVLDWSQG